jgi:hypothetical protein
MMPRTFLHFNPYEDQSFQGSQYRPKFDILPENDSVVLILQQPLEAGVHHLEFIKSEVSAPAGFPVTIDGQPTNTPMTVESSLPDGQWVFIVK